MTALRITNARILTMRGPGTLGEVIPRGEIDIQHGRISRVAPSPTRAPNAEENARPSDPNSYLDARGRVLMPAFIDAHTHALWTGDRLDEWDMKRRGAPYLDILKSGGGIMATVRALRAAPPEALTHRLLARLDIIRREGTTTIEIKSGYGLTTADELKMLRVIRDAQHHFPGTLIPTALLGHALDPDVNAERFIDTTINETLPAVHDEFPGIAIDAYCESGAWPLEACTRLFERAIDLGHPFRVHTDQFNPLGMTEWAIAHAARSVDHLEASTPESLARVAASRSFAVLLPCTGFHTDNRYADGRTLIDAGAADRLVIATNCNPGSAPCSSMPLAIALAVRRNRLTPAEALAACTRNAAALLGLGDRGAIAPGMRADLILLRHDDERELAHQFGGNPVDELIINGELTRTRL